MENLYEPLSMLDVIDALRQSTQALDPFDHKVQIAVNQRLVSRLLASINVVKLPAEVELKEGEVFVGGIINAQGEGNYIVLLPGEVHRLHDQRLDWAINKGGLIPNTVELELCFKNCREEFTADFYTTCDECENNENYVLVKNFGTGAVTTQHKLDWCTARAIRRIPFKTTINAE